MITPFVIQPTKFVTDFPFCPVCLSNTKTNGRPGYFYENRASCSRQRIQLANDGSIHFEPEDDGLVAIYFPARNIAEIRQSYYPRNTTHSITMSFSDFQYMVLTYKTKQEWSISDCIRSGMVES